jgi:uncharacterized protein YciI
VLLQQSQSPVPIKSPGARIWRGAGELDQRRCSVAPIVLSCQSGAMFVIELIYKAELSEIDAHMKAHMAFLKKHYAAGTFLVSGRKIPREGGIILALGKDKQEIEAVMAQDPFCKHGLAEFRVIEFRANQRADDIPKRVEG